MAWREKRGDDWHRAVHSGRPFLAFGTPRYGHMVERMAIVHFITGKGCLEGDMPFNPIRWQPLPEPPSLTPNSDSKEEWNG